MSSVVVSSVGWSGCAPRDAGFSSVKTTVHERIGHSPRFRDVEGEEDAETTRKVRELLARPLDAEGAVQIAMLRNPELQAAFTKLGVARATLLGASKPPNIELHGSLAFPEGGGSPHLEFEATESLTGLIAWPLRHAEGSAVLVSAQLSAASDALDIAYQTRQAYYECQAAEQEAAIVRDVAATAALTAELLSRLHSAGNVTDLELAETRAFEQHSLLIVAEAEQAVIDRRATLWRWLGGPGRPTALKIAPNLPGPDAELPALAELEQRALDRSLDLRRLRAEHERLDKRQSVASLVGLLPDVRAGVHFERDHDEWAIGPSAALSLPLFDQGQAAVDAAEAEQRGLAYERAAHALRVRAATLSLHSRLEIAHGRVQRYVQQLLPLRSQIVQQSLLQYNAMQIGVAQLLVARRSELEENRAYVGALRSYWLLRSELDQLLAGRLMDGMSGPGHSGRSGAAPSMPAGDPGGH